MYLKYYYIKNPDGTPYKGKIERGQFLDDALAEEFRRKGYILSDRP